jgi:hypothetical protein
VAKLLKPHTTEWFRWLARTAPHQALATREIVRRAGRIDVCSMCGDRPATDYSLDGIPGAVRQCEDRSAIRRAQGENFEAVTWDAVTDCAGE